MNARRHLLIIVMLILLSLGSAISGFLYHAWITGDIGGKTRYVLVVISQSSSNIKSVEAKINDGPYYVMLFENNISDMRYSSPEYLVGLKSSSEDRDVLSIKISVNNKIIEKNFIETGISSEYDGECLIIAIIDQDNDVNITNCGAIPRLPWN